LVVTSLSNASRDLTEPKSTITNPNSNYYNYNNTAIAITASRLISTYHGGTSYAGARCEDD